MAGGCLRALAVVVAWFPWRFLGVPGALLGWLVGTVFRVRRTHVEGAMQTAGVPAQPRVARAMYAALGRSVFEFLWLSRRGEEAVLHVVVDAKSRAAWRGLLVQRRGVVIAASHTGNWDLAAAAVARDVELLVVTKRLSARSLDRFWQSTRARRGVHLSEATGALARARAVLGRGGAVAMMVDQAPASPKRAVGIDFLGRRALADRAPAALAAIAGAPLVVVAGRRDARGAHVLYVLAIIDPPPARGGGARQDWIADATSSASQALETFVRAYPSQWLWLHRRWKGAANASGVDPCARAATLPSPC